MIDAILFRSRLLSWYGRHKRSLPWRATNDPYCVWVSEIMLQQTRVAAVVPYYERFLERFPDVHTLAAAGEQDVLNAWAGLGYYSRARNLQKAAQQIVGAGEFPRCHEEIRALAGIGEYTAAAIGSIAFQLAHAAMDGNVVRVLARISAEPGDVTTPAVRARLRERAKELLDRQSPGDFNQAMMELGATVCLPAVPQCLLCPVAEQCESRRAGRQREYPVKRGKPKAKAVEQRLLWIEREGRYLFWQRQAGSRRMAGFWDLPQAEQLPEARLGGAIGGFRHTIVNTNYRFELVRAYVERAPQGFSWWSQGELNGLPVSTVARKALALATAGAGPARKRKPVRTPGASEER